MAEDLPYKAEYAKSGRAACKGCKEKIDNAELRLAVMVQSPMFDGKVPHWYHFMCFFSKQRPKSVGDIDKYGTLRYEDQKRIQEKIESKMAAGTTADDLRDFSTEYAKSNKSTCKGCSEKIAKGEVRISKLDYDGAFSKMRGPVPQWYHVDCFVKKRDDLDYTLGADSIPGFMSLGVDDQRMLKEKIKKLDRKRKPKAADETDGPPAKQAKVPEDPEEEKALKKQSDLVYKLRDDLQKNLSKKELQELLEFNEIDIPAGESRILDLLGDCMAFGCLERCPECKEGQLKLRTDAYACTGNISGWTKCQYLTQDPQRTAFKVPPEFKETYPFLKKYKYVARKRVFPKNPAKPSEPSTSANGKAGKDLPLDGIEVALGKTSASADELKQKLILLGAKPVSKVSEKTLCLISTAEDVKKKSKKVKEAELHNVHVVSEDFVDHLAKGSGAAEAVVGQFKIAPWGGDAGSKIEKYKTKSQMDKMFAKSGPSMMKLTVKGLAVVEPESGLADVAHVYTRDKEIFSSVLGMVDVSRGTNSYYKLQLLESDQRNRYWVYRAWGRVGTSVGSNKLEQMDTLEEAKHHFKALFEEKTGNPWSQRKDMVKQPNRFYPLELDYGQEGSGKTEKMKPGKNSKLHRAVQELICMIFDMDNFKKTMVEFEIDLTKMPLGKLSKRQIQQAYSVLTELSELIKNGGSESKFLDASNRFYTLIPHDFGMRKPTILNNEELIKQKIGMVDSLLEIEVAYSMLKVEATEAGTDPVDFHYSQLKAGIEVVSRDSDEFALMSKYVETTHAETHRSYKLQILELFKVAKDGEAKRYKPFKKLPNRKLLWHGSRLSNFAGILSQGLRIAPPEAPVTGYMFGKGIYFADMVSKSANYCCTSPSNPVGLLLLCEVALGNMYIDRDPETIKKQEALAKKEKLDLDDQDRLARFIDKQIERDRQRTAEPPSTADANLAEFRREDEEEKVVFKLAPSSSKQPEDTTKKEGQPRSNPLEMTAKADKHKAAPSECEVRPKKQAKKSALDEIMQEQETKREKLNRKPYWVTEGIVVKVMAKKLGDKYYKKKGVVQDVQERYVGVVRMLDSGDVLKVDQTHLETVIPNLGRRVKVVNGAYRGEEALLLEVDQRGFCAKLRVDAGPISGRVLERVAYEDFSKLHVPS